MPLPISVLFSPQTTESLKTSAYGLLTGLGLAVTSWQPGDPSRTIVAVFSELLSQFTTSIVTIAKSGFLDYATKAGLTLLADQVFDVQRDLATYATGFITLTNAGGGSYEYDPDEVLFQNSTTGATFRNAEAFTLGPGATSGPIAIKAVSIGSGGSSAATQVDTLVTTLLGVTCSNAAVLVGVDEESDASVRIRCRDKLKSLSPMGPRAAYDYVARTSTLNGGVHVTRTQVLGDNTSGEVTIYIADEDGAISAPDVALVQAGIDEWAAPIAIEADVQSATGVIVPVAATVYLYASTGLSDDTVTERIQSALTTFFQTTRIGGDVIPPAGGSLYVKSVEDAIARALPEAFLVTVTTPASTVAIATGDVATLGAITPTITRIAG